MIITAIKIICIVLAIVLIVLVILQQGKGSDLGSAFGGGSSNSMFGAVGPSNFLGKLTAFIATLFLILNLAQAVLLKNANTEVLLKNFETTEKECKSLLDKKLSLPAYDQCLKASHIFNLLDARGVIGVAERTGYITRIRELAKGC